MNFKQLKEICFNTIDEIDEDNQIDIIVSNALNESYAVLSRKDKRLARAFIPIINGIATLPMNCLDIIKTTPELNGADQIIGTSILTKHTGVLETLYNYKRDRLVNDEDEPDLHENLQDAMVAYACYRYWQHRKKVEVAQLFFRNYSEIVYSFEPENTAIQEVVQWV